MIKTIQTVLSQNLWLPSRLRILKKKCTALVPHSLSLLKKYATDYLKNTRKGTVKFRLRSSEYFGKESFYVDVERLEVRERWMFLEIFVGWYPVYESMHAMDEDKKILKKLLQELKIHFLTPWNGSFPIGLSEMVSFQDVSEERGNYDFLRKCPTVYSRWGVWEDFYLKVSLIVKEKFYEDSSQDKPKYDFEIEVYNSEAAFLRANSVRSGGFRVYALILKQFKDRYFPSARSLEEVFLLYGLRGAD